MKHNYDMFGMVFISENRTFSLFSLFSRKIQNPQQH